MFTPPAATTSLPSPSRLGRVAVVMGGWSAEREISLRSGQQILQALCGKGVDAHGIDADRNVVTTLINGNFDRVFLILHGRGGEDGCIQGALDIAEIPYTGSGVLGSALAMDKVRAKTLVQSVGIRTPEWRLIDNVESARKGAEELGFPVIVKPVSEGSSIGVNKAMENQVADAFEDARQYGDVMLEKFIVGKEVTAAIVNDQALPLVSMNTPRLFYDYEAKYFSDSTAYECPCALDQTVEDSVKRAALTAFRAIGASGWGRIDFMLDEQDEAYFIELNTAPGMTDHSLVPMAAAAVGLDFAELCLAVLATTLVPTQTSTLTSGQASGEGCT